VSRLLLDTSAYSAFRRGDVRLKDPVQRASQLVLNPVVIGELLAGFKKGSRRRQNSEILRDFMSSSRVLVVSIEEETAEHYASILDALRREGTPVPVNDIWIAASAAQHGLRVLTLDEHFTWIPQVLVEYFEPPA